MTLLLSGTDGLSDVDGSAATPAIRGTDANTGIFFPAADTIAFSEGGAESARFDSSGNLGIGTTSPAYPLTLGNNRQIGSLNTSGSAVTFAIVNGSNNLVFGDDSVNTNSLTVQSRGSMLFQVNTAERMRIDNSGRLLVGTTTFGGGLTLAKSDTTFRSGSNAYPFPSGNSYLMVNAASTNSQNNWIGITGEYGATSGSANLLLQATFNNTSQQAGNYIGSEATSATSSALTFGIMMGGASTGTAASKSEAMRINSNGQLLVGSSSSDDTNNGFRYFPGTGPNTETILAVTNQRNDTGGETFIVNRQNTDGQLIQFRQANTPEGGISVSGTTVSYNGGHLSRWAQTTTPKDDSLLKGTVLSNLDEMNEYVKSTTYWVEEDEIPEGVNVGDVKEESSVVENEQLNKVKVSDVEGDINVAGVFVNWSHDTAHDVDEINMAMTGDMIIRIAQGVTVQRGDLLMSAGDGTAKPQGDDIVRGKTVAKVTSTHITCTYADGSYCVPCVLMAC